MWNTLLQQRRASPEASNTERSRLSAGTSHFATLSALRAQPPEGVRLLTDRAIIAPAPQGFVAEWLLELRGVEGTVYAGEVYQLRFRFPERYPLESPEVTFVGRSPLHRHVYSNGHICLSILYDGWSPALNVESICISLLSMLSSSVAKERPPDDREYVAICGRHVSPKSMRWVFHDDTV